MPDLQRVGTEGTVQTDTGAKGNAYIKAVAVLIINILEKCPLPVCYGDGKRCFLGTDQIVIPHYLSNLSILHAALDHPHGKLGRADSGKVAPWKGSSGKLHQHIVENIFQAVLVGFAKLMGIHDFWTFLCAVLWLLGLTAFFL